VIKPGCNEGEVVKDAALSVLSSDYPDLELILIDDRSMDNTGSLMDHIARSDSRTRVIHIKNLPADWLGKVNALQQGYLVSSGKWLLFSDADVHLHPEAIRRSIAYAETRGLDFLPVIPELLPAGILVDSMIVMFLRAGGMIPFWEFEDPKSKTVIGIGAYNLVRRSAFEKTPGFEWLKLEVTDDAGLGLMMKRSGARCSIINGQGMVWLHWYRSVKEMFLGMEKAGYASVGIYSNTRLLILCILFILLEFSPFLAVCWLGHPVFQLIGMSIVMIAYGVTWKVGRLLNYSCWSILLFPVGSLLGIMTMIRSGYLGWKRGGILWRGTLYPTDLLKPGKRFFFP
jgi:glycosyltransferase involved in cell wall biosynthesis